MTVTLPRLMPAEARPLPATVVMNPLAARGPCPAEALAVLDEAGLARARAVIGGWDGYAPTPLRALPELAKAAGVAAIHYKDEGGRFGLGSFKALGGAYAVARLLAREVGAAQGAGPVPVGEIASGVHAEAVARVTVCCATDGNHGRSVAWGAQRFGCACVIFIHAGVSDARRDAIAQYGAEVRRAEGNYDDSVRAAQETATAEGWFVVSDTSYPGYTDIPRDVMQGYEVMAAEALEQLDQPPTHVLLQTGVGGMAAAVAACLTRRMGAARPVFILADPDRAACWVDSLAAGHPVAVEGDLDTLMAGLACGEVSVLAWDVLRTLVDAAVAVSDADALAMMRCLASGCGGAAPGVVAGESAVAGLVALLAIRADPAAARALALGPDARVLVFGTEGDTDAALYREIVGRTAASVRGVSS